MQLLAFGAETKTNFTVYEKGRYSASRTYNDLKDIRDFADFERDLNKAICGKKPGAIACDLHPGYVATEYAKKVSRESGAKIFEVQHHFAHLLSVLEENNLAGPAIGFAFDGTGFGDDNKSWGSEVMLVTKKKYKRLYHLEYVSQPGADAAAREPWRMAVSYLYRTFGKDIDVIPGFKKRIGEKKIKAMISIIENDINSPETSSLGRLFDSVSSMLGICDVHSFEAEAAIKLEKAADSAVRETYPFEISGEEILTSSIVKGIVSDIRKKKEPSFIAARFINTIGRIVYDLSGIISRKEGAKDVVVSGGCFQNKLLSKRVAEYFAGSSPKLFTNKVLPPTDTNISFGQAVYLKERVEKR